MKRIMLATVLLLGAFDAQAQSIGGSPFIAVRGNASEEAVPDRFPLELVLKETSLDAAATQAKIEQLARDVLAVADRMKIREEDVTVSNLSISPDYEYDEKTEKQVFLGNTYQREIKLRFHSLDGMRAFIEAIPSSKALHLDTGAFGTSRADEIRRGLLQKAIDNARKTAEALASGVGRKLGTVHTISNQGFNMRYSESATTLDTVTVTGSGVALLAPGTVSLREGRITLSQDVYIIYTLID